MSEKKILIGKIVSVFGVKGEVKIMSYCQNLSDIGKYQIFDKNDQEIKIKIRKSQELQNPLIAQIEGIQDRNQAELLRNKELFTNRSDLKKLPKNEFYHTDLIGLSVLDEATKKEIGKIVNIADFGAGAIIEIEFLEKVKNQLTDFHFNKETFPQIDLQKGFVTFNAPEF